jgi:hypothetical protein
MHGAEANELRSVSTLAMRWPKPYGIRYNETLNNSPFAVFSVSGTQPFGHFLGVFD